MGEQPTMDQMWTLLQEQRAEIDRLKDEVTAHKQQGTSASRQAGVAVLPSQPAADAGPGTVEGLRAEVAANGGGPEKANGHRPVPAQPAPTRKGWRPRLGRSKAVVNGQQKLLPKADDTTPVEIGRRLSRMGLLKAAAAGVVGVTAAEVAGSTGTPQAHAFDGQDYFVARGGYGANSIAFQTADHSGYSGYDWGVLVSGNRTAIEGSSNEGWGVLGRSGSRFPGVEGISSRDSNVRYGFDSAPGVRGMSQLDGRPGNGVGVEGVSGNGVGVEGVSGTGAGVLGTATSGAGLWGQSDTGIGVRGEATSGTGLWGRSGGLGIRGSSSGSGMTGIYGTHTANDGVGVTGRSFKDFTETALGRGTGVRGDSGTGVGVRGTTSAVARLGISGPVLGGVGVKGESLAGVGVWGLSHENTPPPGHRRPRRGVQQ